MPLAIVLKSKQGFSDYILPRRYDTLGDALDARAKKREMNGESMFQTREIAEVIDTKRTTKIVRFL
jgi:hypothetical protein